MVPIYTTFTQTNLLIYVGGCVFVLLGAFYLGRLVTFFFPSNPLIKKENDELTPNKKNLSSFSRKPQINQRRITMPDVKLNSGSGDVGMKFKIIEFH